MESNINKARRLFATGNYTCVLCKDEKIFTSAERGIKPLLAWLDTEENFQGFCAADKVVGKAAAYLYVLLGVEEVYAVTMSESAREIFTQYNVAFQYETLTSEIRNRTNTGLCPMEEAVKDAVHPSEALENIRKKQAVLAMRTGTGI
ncbi:MAG: DUF1893 domain-containing protein [Lachnospiraceae bacterium]